MSTLLKQAVSGKETRLQLWQNPIWEFRLTYEFLGMGFRGNNDLQTLIDFYLARAGAFDSFLYTDPTDNAVTGQFLGKGDGVTTRFQLARSFVNSLALEVIQNINQSVTIPGAMVSGTFMLGEVVKQNFSLAAATLLTIPVPSSGPIALSAITPGVIAQVTGSVTSGSFIQGEVIKQTVTNAQGVESVNGLAGSANLYISGTITGGTPDASHTWVGQTSGAVYTPTSAPVAIPWDPIHFWTGQTSGAQFAPSGLGSAPALNVYDNGGVVSAANYSVDSLGGIVFTVAPASGHIITADFSYYFRVRFGSIAGNAQAKDGDSLEFENFMNQLWQLKQVSFVSAKL